MRPETLRLISLHRLPVVFSVAGPGLPNTRAFLLAVDHLESSPPGCAFGPLIFFQFLLNCPYQRGLLWPLYIKELAPVPEQAPSLALPLFSPSPMVLVFFLQIHEDSDFVCPVPGSWNTAHHSDIPDSLLIPARDAGGGRAFLTCLESHC